MIPTWRQSVGKQSESVVLTDSSVLMGSQAHNTHARKHTHTHILHRLHKYTNTHITHITQINKHRRDVTRLIESHHLFIPDLVWCNILNVELFLAEVQHCTITGSVPGAAHNVETEGGRGFIFYFHEIYLWSPAALSSTTYTRFQIVLSKKLWQISNFTPDPERNFWNCHLIPHQCYIPPWPHNTPVLHSSVSILRFRQGLYSALCFPFS